MHRYHKRRRRIILALLLCLVSWKLVRMDWIVQCEYACCDGNGACDRGTAYYTPPISPIWAPPSPSAITGRPHATWNDYEFFQAGGSYGPTSTAVLRPNWFLIAVKLSGVYTVYRVVEKVVLWVRDFA